MSRYATLELLAIIRRWHIRRMTIRALWRLSDHSLKDIGIPRGSIESVADQLSRSTAPDWLTAQQRLALGFKPNTPPQAPHSRARVGRRSQTQTQQHTKLRGSQPQVCPPKAV